MKFVRASAPGNLFFCGEHAVVYGFPGIIASINCRAYCTVRENKNIKIVSDLFGSGKAGLVNGKLEGIFFEARELNNLFYFLEELSKKLEFKKGFELQISSLVPPESGMSSSTAVLCSILHALNEFFSWGIEKKKYFEFVFPAQLKIHGGKASGSEIISSCVGGFNKIKKRELKSNPVMDFEFLGSHEFSIVVGDTRIRAPTSLTVGMHIPSLMKKNPELVKNSFKKIEGITHRIETALKNEDLEMLGSLMNENQEVLSKLGLSHPKLDDCITQALNAGALGAKLSGGGWGGVMFALCEKDKILRIKKAIGLTGARTITTRIGGSGARIEK